MKTIRNFSHWLYGVSTSRVTLVALAIFILFTSLVLPAQSAAMRSEAGSPDLSFYYTADDLYRMAESYGEQRRRDYVIARFTFDVIWPVVYTFFLATATSWLFQRAFPPDSFLRLMNLTPLLAAFFDFLENASTSWVMLLYPESAGIVAHLAGFFTVAKWLLLVDCLALLLIGLDFWLLRRFQS